MDEEDYVPYEEIECEEFSARRYDNVSTHKTKVDALLAMELSSGGVYKFLYNDGPRGRASTYRCISHVECPKVMRLVDSLDGSHITLQESGIHGEIDSDENKSGVSLVVKSEAEAMLCGGAGPKTCLAALELKYKDNAAILGILPDSVQLKNLKAQLRIQMEGGWEIKNPAQLLEWASERMCESACVFFGVDNGVMFAENLKSEMDELIVLRLFEHDVDTPSGRVKSFGMVFTSRNIFLNLKKAIEGQQSSGVFGATDGTYKLHFGGWTLVNFGTYSTRYYKGTFSKHYVPFTFMFVRTEHTNAYKELFTTTRCFGQCMFGVDLCLALGSLDHAVYIANAFQAVWPSISLLTCWPHLVRKAKEQSSRLKDSSYFDSTIHPHLDILHSARSHGQFTELAKLCVAEWRAKGEGTYADWFGEVYLTSPWDSWHGAASGTIAGVLPSQNALEAFHRVIKKVCVKSLRATTAHVLNNSLPGILRAATTEKSQDLVAHYCEGPIPAVYVARAHALIQNSHNYMLLRRATGAEVTAVVYNADEYVNCVGNPHKGLQVTKQRMTRYTNSLSGKLVANKPVTEAKLLYQSLNRVLVLSPDCPTFGCIPVWKVAQIEQVRTCFRCDCLDYMQTGWICEHVLATMTLLKFIDTGSQMTALPIRKKPGGQFKSRGPLSRHHHSKTDKQYFSATRLGNMFVELPTSPIHWRLVEEVDVTVNGETLKEHLQGEVFSWLENKGRYKWRVVFSNGVEKLFDVNALATAIAYSHSVGTRVIPALADPL